MGGGREVIDLGRKHKAWMGGGMRRKNDIDPRQRMRVNEREWR